MNTQQLKIEADLIRKVGRLLEWVLLIVAVGALVFTMINVTNFGVEHQVPKEIAWLLDPIASLTLLAVLVGDGVLSRHAVKLGGWSTVVKLIAGGATWSMNIWDSVATGDHASVLLHSVAPALVIGLAEVTPRYRMKFAKLINDLEDQMAQIQATESALRVAEKKAAAAVTPKPQPRIEVAEPGLRSVKTPLIETMPIKTNTLTVEEAADLDEIQIVRKEGFPNGWYKPLMEAYGGSRTWWISVKKAAQEAA